MQIVVKLLPGKRCQPLGDVGGEGHNVRRESPDVPAGRVLENAQNALDAGASQAGIKVRQILQHHVFCVHRAAVWIV
ncbi:hypothetical protein A5651_02820 [Mycobacterium sp. 1274761.0]|nr:hypothetical protein A5651_02820 [Mycobacterium sp. 1274761.0]